MFALVSPIIFALVVSVLGFITPGYSHLNHTMSRLALAKHGWIQSLNFLQLALGIYLTGIRITVMRTIFTISSFLLVIAAFFPTDPIENVPLDLSLLSPSGLVHVGVVILFLLFSPLGIIRLASVFLRQPKLRRFALPTLIAGFTAFLGSIIWFAFFFLGIYLEYRGIFQKAIALPVLLWLVFINRASLEKR